MSQSNLSNKSDYENFKSYYSAPSSISFPEPRRSSNPNVLNYPFLPVQLPTTNESVPLPTKTTLPSTEIVSSPQPTVIYVTQPFLIYQNSKSQIPFPKQPDLPHSGSNDPDKVNDTQNKKQPVYPLFERKNPKIFGNIDNLKSAGNVIADSNNLKINPQNFKEHSMKLSNSIVGKSQGNSVLVSNSGGLASEIPSVSGSKNPISQVTEGNLLKSNLTQDGKTSDNMKPIAAIMENKLETIDFLPKIPSVANNWNFESLHIDSGKTDFSIPDFSVNLRPATPLSKLAELKLEEKEVTTEMLDHKRRSSNFSVNSLPSYHSNCSSFSPQKNNLNLNTSITPVVFSGDSPKSPPPGSSPSNSYYSRRGSHAPKPVSLEGDIEALLRCFRGVTADEKILFDIVGRRPLWHLDQLAEKFRDQNGQTLLHCIQRTTDSLIFETSKAFLTSWFDYEALCISDALKGLFGVDMESLFEILSGRSNFEMEQLKIHYEKLTNERLLSSINNKVSNNMRHFFNILLRTVRDESEVVTPEKIESVSKLMVEALSRRKTDDSQILTILCMHSKEVLRESALKYELKKKRGCEESVKRHFHITGDSEKGLLSLMRAIQDINEFAATEIEKSMKGLGMKEFKLIRLLSRFTRLGALKKVAETYNMKNKITLSERISKETSGGFRDLLLACLEREA
ncbi:Annexin A13 [Lobulomyces angularis]|nr:Annexin A13 [Lobulomyces angularis]